MIGHTLITEQKQKLTLSQLHAGTIGEIPLFSVHRIQTIWSKKSPKISAELSRIFIREVFKQNVKFKEKSGKKWNCITLHNMQFAISDTDDFLSKEIDKNKDGLEKLLVELVQQKDEQIGLISKWFEDNYEDILYSLNSKLPWLFIKYLKSRLHDWRQGVEFVFDEEIVDLKDKFDI